MFTSYLELSESLKNEFDSVPYHPDKFKVDLVYIDLEKVIKTIPSGIPNATRDYGFKLDDPIFDEAMRIIIELCYCSLMYDIDPVDLNDILYEIVMNDTSIRIDLNVIADIPEVFFKSVIMEIENVLDTVNYKKREMAYLGFEKTKKYAIAVCLRKEKDVLL